MAWHLQGWMSLNLVATVLNRCRHNSSTRGHPGLTDSNTGLLEVHCRFIVHPDTITTADFSTLTFVILMLHNVHDYFTLAIVNTCVCCHSVLIPILLGMHTWWIMQPSYNAWNLIFSSWEEVYSVWEFWWGIGTYNAWNLIFYTLRGRVLVRYWYLQCIGCSQLFW